VSYRYDADGRQPICMLDLVSQRPGELETAQQVNDFMSRAARETKLPIDSLRPQDIPEPKLFSISYTQYCASLRVMSFGDAYAGVCEIKSYSTIA